MLTHFGSIIFDEFGGIAHALVDSYNDEEKVLKILDILFKNGVNCEYTSDMTGYTFIHLALYGYTDKNDIEHSYSESFIIKLINLAKEYNFDFNIQDNDGDTIIHTAIASEVYTGSVINLLNLIQDEFDIKMVNNLCEDIYQTLLLSLKEAESYHNHTWLKRLNREKKL